MPEDVKKLQNLRDLFEYIIEKSDGAMSRGVALYAVGWIFYDIFERSIHNENRDGKPLLPEDLDKFVRDLPMSKIQRDIDDAQQDFGQSAATFMEEDTKKRIEQAINESIVSSVRSSNESLLSTVKSYTSGFKTFAMNVLAGVVSGAIFAAVTLGLYFYVNIDPSLNKIAKDRVQHSDGPSPAPPP